MENLAGLKVAILVDNGFEQVELTEPRKALQAAGATTHVVSPQKDKVRGWNHTEWGDYDALVLPGGVYNPDKLRVNTEAVAFVKAFFDDGRPVAAICHGPWTIIETGAARGRRLTSYASIKTDLINAGANWIDEAVVTDGNLTTSRKPDDIPAFNEAMVKQFKAGSRQARKSA
jgi:protease I